MERKKVQKEIVPEVGAKKRTEADIPKPPAIEIETKTETIRLSDSKPKRSEDKYIRIAMGSTSEERKVFTDKEARGEIKMSHYADDSGIGYHYYLILKNNN